MFLHASCSAFFDDREKKAAEKMIEVSERSVEGEKRGNKEKRGREGKKIYLGTSAWRGFVPKHRPIINLQTYADAASQCSVS